MMRFTSSRLVCAEVQHTFSIIFSPLKVLKHSYKFLKHFLERQQWVCYNNMVSGFSMNFLNSANH